MPSSVNVPASISSASRSRAVSFAARAGGRSVPPAALPGDLAPIVQVVHERAKDGRATSVGGRPLGGGQVCPVTFGRA